MRTSEERLCLDRERGLLGGVCAGLGRYFGVPNLGVRVIFVLATFTFAFTLFGYLVLFFVMKANGGEHTLSPGEGLARLRGFNWRRPLYKNRAAGKLQGVCAGLGDYLNLSPTWIRLALLVSLVFGPLAVLLYIAAAVVLEDKPLELSSGSSASSNRLSGDGVKDLSQRFERLEQRLRRIEATITSKKFHLHRELKKMSG